MRLLIVCAITCFSHLCAGQDSLANKTATRLEEFLDQRSRLIQKEFINIGKVRDVTVEVLGLTDLSTNQFEIGIRLSWVNVIGYTPYFYAVFLDTEEIVDVQTAIGRMIEVAKGPIPANDTELIFASKSDLQITLYQSGASGSKKWMVSVKDMDRPSTSSNTIKGEDLSKLLSLLSTAKQVIDQS